MRNALNALQSTAAGVGSITAEAVFKVVDQPHPKVVGRIVEWCEKGKLRSALTELEGLWRAGYSGMDIITTLFRVVK